MNSMVEFMFCGFDIVISYECEKLRYCVRILHISVCVNMSQCSGESASPLLKSARSRPNSVSSVRLCHLLITHSLSVFVTLTLTQTRQVEPPDNQNQAWTCGCNAGKKVGK